MQGVGWKMDGAARGWALAVVRRPRTGFPLGKRAQGIEALEGFPFWHVADGDLRGIWSHMLPACHRVIEENEFGLL